jgi:regulator of RNase E activity RraB
MKALLLFFLALSLFGTDIQRLEGIVEEITNLRAGYESCTAKLLEKEQGTIVADVQNNSDVYLQERIKELEESIQAKEILANIQAREIMNLQQKNEQILKDMQKKEMLTSVFEKAKETNPPAEILCDDRNPFPKLMMKIPQTPQK